MPKRKTELAKAPIRDIIRSVGSKMISAEAVNELTAAAIQFIRDVSSDALKLVRHGKRTKMTGEDVKFALKMRTDNKIPA